MRRCGRATRWQASRLFQDECYWRDLVSLTWNIKTVEGRDAIAGMLAKPAAFTRPSELPPQGRGRAAHGDVIGGVVHLRNRGWRGACGHLRLKDGKGYTILTTMQELKGHEEKRGRTREKGIVHGATRDRRTWTDEREEEQRELGYSRQPYCLIIGGGQGGIALGARLKRLGVPTIIVEKNARAGDSWRNRYRSLVLHDPVWYDHLPYLPFPDHWPVFTPKDKMGDWLEMYVKVMELNYWTSSEAVKASYDPAAKEWTVLVRRDGQDVVLTPKHLVFATGSYGPPREVSIPGQKDFEGIQYHSARHQSADGPSRASAASCWAPTVPPTISAPTFGRTEREATMIQRTPTTVVRSETLMDVAFGSLYSEEAVERGIDVDKADMIFASAPFRLMPALQKPLYEEMARRDADLICSGSIRRASGRTSAR